MDTLVEIHDENELDVELKSNPTNENYLITGEFNLSDALQEVFQYIVFSNDELCELLGFRDKDYLEDFSFNDGKIFGKSTLALQLKKNYQVTNTIPFMIVSHAPKPVFEKHKNKKALASEASSTASEQAKKIGQKILAVFSWVITFYGIWFTIGLKTHMVVKLILILVFLGFSALVTYLPKHKF